MKIYIIRICIFFIVSFTVSNTFGQKSAQGVENYKGKFATNIDLGLHFGDRRFYVAPITSIAAKYYITDVSSLELIYMPVYVKSKTDVQPLFYYNSKELTKGKSALIHEFFFVYSKNVFYRAWLQFGIAPVLKYSVFIGLSYEFPINSSYSLLANYKLLSIGFPIQNGLPDLFFSNSFTCGIQYYFTN